MVYFIGCLLAVLGNAQATASSSNVNLRVTANVLPGASTLSVSPTNYSFGVINPAPDNIRFKSEQFTLHYFAANGPWEIRVCTDNLLSLEGFVSTSFNQVPLRVNQPNFGPGGDPEMPDNWTNFWSIVLDCGSVSAPLLGSSEPPIEDPSTFDRPFWLAVQITTNDVKEEYTADLNVEFMFE